MVINKSVLMIVDDERVNINFLNEILSKDFQIKVAINGEQALTRAHTKPIPDLILLDIKMPGIDGYQICKQLKSKPETTKIPIIFITMLSNTEDEKKGLELGAVDYITKPFNPSIIIARINTHLRLKTINEELEKKNIELEKLASIDPLTGLFNRRYFYQLAKQEEKRCIRDKTLFCLILLDIDHFKQVNDTHGHECGDMVLKGITRCLKETLRDIDIISRWGGEEFLCLLPETSPGGAKKAAEKIRTGIEQMNLEYMGNKIKTSATFGIKSYDKLKSIDVCIKSADQSLYKGKENGRNQVVLAE